MGNGIVFKEFNANFAATKFSKKLSNYFIMNGRKIEALLVAVAIVVLGLSIKGGLESFAQKDRVVTVKGLAEMEVPANKVTWPIVSKEVGNDLPSLYASINSKNATIKKFLMQNGISEEEISINAPEVLDLNAERYGENRTGNRYNIRTVIIVTSTKVDNVRAIMARQGELLKDGIAIVAGEYEYPVVYEYTSFNEIKSKMMDQAIANARTTAEQFATTSGSKLNKIEHADQGQFSIDNRDSNSPYIKKLRVVTTITYSLKD